MWNGKKISFFYQYGGYNGQYGSSYGSSRGGSYGQWYGGRDGGYGSGGPSSTGGASALGGPSSSSRIGGYRHSPSRDEGGYGSRDHHHHHPPPLYGRGGGSSRSGPTRSYSNSMNTSGTGSALYSSHQVRGQHNYHPYAR
ncbi:hypothetical protein Glove_22g79 [Diversispora epigaea]|uniref:Uncharacterized protein n=1 Tax=Diversispora epigaea TaxID=1348612 RepID=A0A397JMD6_9GLOM|nr:hypothetical protein Glove_22g79 [Diversispora epigaea]